MALLIVQILQILLDLVEDASDNSRLLEEILKVKVNMSVGARADSSL